VSVREFWTLTSPGDRTIRKRADTLDLWVRQANGWRLASRFSQFSEQWDRFAP
jgi:hypothetical protein